MFRMFLLSCLLLLTAPILAQDEDDGRYVHPLFSAPTPQGWTDASTEEMGYFISPDEAVNLYLFAIEDGDGQAASAQIIPGFDGTPLQSSEVPLEVITWTQDVYMLESGDLLVVLHTAVEDGYTYVIGIQGGQSVLAAVNPILNDILLSFEINSVDTSVPSVPSVPSAPYAEPSQYTEQEVTIVTGRWELGGTLLMPISTDPVPAVVIVHGSGSSDRDATFYDINKPYRDLAEGLASNGIAVLRYDKRTLVYGLDYADDIVAATLQEETIDDALSAIELLRNTPGIDPEQIYVAGHSLGGMAVPEIARQAGNLAGIIIMAGNSRSLLDVTLEQFDYLAALPINAAEESQATLNEWRAYVETILTLTEESDPNQFLFGAYVPYWLDLMAYDQVATAQALDIPILVLQGERDYQVTMVDFELWQEALPDATFISYPALNHIFLPGEGMGTPAEYAVAGHVSETVIVDMVNWIE